MKLELQLGQSAAGQPLIWSNPNNGHMFISGKSGVGKSYLLKSLIPQLPPQGFRVFIFDCSADFISENGNPPQWPVADMEVLNLHDSQISLAPFQPRYPGETPGEIANRFSDTLRTGLRLGDSQWAYVSNIIEEGLTEGNLDSFQDLVDVVDGDIAENDTAKRLLPKLKKLGSLLPKGIEPYEWKLNETGITVIDLHHIYDIAAQAILIELLLGTICGLRMSGVPNEDHPVVLVFDECQRLRLKEGSFANRILREGRKFGLSGWYSTQWVSRPEEQQALGQAALHIHFRPDDSNLHRTALSLGLQDKTKISHYEHRLASLKRGCFMYQDGKKIRFNKVS